MSPQQRHAGRRVVARVALADVVEQGAEHEQVGPVDAVGERGGVGGGLPQVPVDGEAVVGVALRAAAHGLPLGQQAHEDAALVERLEHVDRPVALRQQQDELVDARRRATASAHAAASTSAASRSSVARDSGTSRWAATRAARSTITGSLAGSARADSSTSRSTTTSPSPTRSSWPSWWRGHVPPRALGDPADRAGGGGDVGHQVVGRRGADGRRRRRPGPRGAARRRAVPVTRCRATRTSTRRP